MPYGEIDRRDSDGPDIFRYKYSGQQAKNILVNVQPIRMTTACVVLRVPCVLLDCEDDAIVPTAKETRSRQCLLEVLLFSELWRIEAKPPNLESVEVGAVMSYCYLDGPE